MSWWRSSVRTDGRTARRPNARRRARKGWIVRPDVFGEPVLWPARREDPALILARLGWRFRRELGPFYIVLGLAIVAVIGNG